MRYSYRITKYHTYIEGTSYLTSSPEEWTCYDEVGSQVSLEDYLHTETQYVDAALAISKMADIDRYQLLFWKKEVENDDEIPYEEGRIITGPVALEESIRHFLRHMGGKIAAVDGTAELHFGWNYYLYIVCNLPYEKVIGKLNTPLNIEAFRSPYLDDL